MNEKKSVSTDELTQLTIINASSKIAGLSKLNLNDFSLITSSDHHIFSFFEKEVVWMKKFTDFSFVSETGTDFLAMIA